MEYSTFVIYFTVTSDIKVFSSLELGGSINHK